MRRIISFASFFIFLLSFLFLGAQQSAAASPCTFTIDPTITNGGVGFHSLTITKIDSKNNLTANKKFSVTLSGNSSCGTHVCLPVFATTDSQGNLSNIVFNRFSFGDGAYTAVVNGSVCSTSFNIPLSGSGGSGSGGCVATVSSDNLNPGGRDAGGLFYTPNNKISLYVSNYNMSGAKDGDKIRVQVKANDQNGNHFYDQCAILQGGQLQEQGSGKNPVPLGSFNSGNYYVEVKKGCNEPIGAGLETMACTTDFAITPTGCDNPDNCSANNNQGTTLGPPPVCAKSGADSKCLGVKTGLSPDPIGTDPGSFIKSLFSVVLSIAGGIAVLIIIVSGFRLISSQGNPEKIQAAREQLIAAVIGLLFIIFSVFILQVIGHDILNIPGFGT